MFGRPPKFVKDDGQAPGEMEKVPVRRENSEIASDGYCADEEVRV